METTMSQMEVLMWLSVIKQAREWNSEAVNHLQAENRIRLEQNRPSVEQELQEIAEEAEISAMVEKAKQRLMKKG